MANTVASILKKMFSHRLALERYGAFAVPWCSSLPVPQLRGLSALGQTMLCGDQFSTPLHFVEARSRLHAIVLEHG